MVKHRYTDLVTGTKASTEEGMLVELEEIGPSSHTHRHVVDERLHKRAEGGSDEINL